MLSDRDMLADQTFMASFALSSAQSVLAKKLTVLQSNIENKGRIGNSGTIVLVSN